MALRPWKENVYANRTARLRVFGITAVCAAAVGISGCGGDDDDGDKPAEAGTTTTATAAASSAVSGPELDWAVDFVAGKAGKADDSKPPFVIGFASQEGGTPSYPEASAGAKSAVKFINEQLGGIDGRPVKLKTCALLAEEDGQKCGAEFVADKEVQAVILGISGVGNASLYKTVLPTLPVLVATSASQADQTTPGVYTLNGGSLSPVAADAVLASQVPGAKRSAVLHSTNAIGTFVATKVLKPVLEQNNLEVTLVPIGDTATAPEVVSAIQAAGAAKAEVFQMTTIVNQCVSAADALKQQKITAKVITTYQCAQPMMWNHFQGMPEGWVFTGYGDNPRIPNAENGRDTYVAVMQADGTKDDVTFNGDSSLSFSTVMALTRMSNDLGAEAGPETIRKAIVNYDGPLMMTPGKPRCGKVSKQFPGICTTLATVAVSEGGELKAQEPLDVAELVK